MDQAGAVQSEALARMLRLILAGLASLAYCWSGARAIPFGTLAHNRRGCLALVHKG
jgi:hypothetical protein